MRRYVLLSGITVLALAAASRAADPPSPSPSPYACPCSETWLDRFVQRAPRPCFPAGATMQRAGYPQELSKCAQPGISPHDYGGYIGGGRVCVHNLCARGPTSGSGPLYYGTYGTDFGGFRGHLSRVFLAPSSDPSRGYPISWNYRAEGPRVFDVFAARPLRKAILEKHEDMEERAHGGEHGKGGEHGNGHGEGGHGAEGEHAPGANGKAPEGKH